MAVFFRIWRFIMLGLFCLILPLGCQPDNRLVIKHEPTARHLQQEILPEINFRNALMSDVALYLTFSVNCVCVYSITQVVNEATVSYKIRVMEHNEGANVVDDAQFVKPFAPTVNYAQTNVSFLKVLEEVARQTKGCVEIDENLIIIKVPKVNAKPSQIQVDVNTNASTGDPFALKPDPF